MAETFILKVIKVSKISWKNVTFSPEQVMT